MFEINRKLLMDRSVADRIGTTLLRYDVPIQPLPKHEVLRKNFDFPEVSEGEIVRYFSQLSQMNFSIDQNFYPLGSCTMKYNPKLNDEISSNPGFANLQALQPESTVQGALKLLFELQQYLTEITGMKGVSLAPMAGADGELAGMLMARAYLLDNGGENRKTVLIPDSAHGTNPASAVMAGFNVVTLPSDTDGNTDLNALKELANDELAGLMITLPSTLGLFDSNILDVIKIVRDSGGIVYGDGANLNALLGKVKLGEIGFDVMHSNLHKTFTQPHGGGGPGAGPVIVGPRLVPYLPAPIVVRDEENGSTIYSFHTPSDSIGKLGAFHGNFGALVRAYAYISTLGNSLDQVTTDAVINANYIKSQLSEVFDLPYDRTCMHEVVLSAKSLKRDYGISALDTVSYTHLRAHET